MLQDFCIAIELPKLISHRLLCVRCQPNALIGSVVWAKILPSRDKRVIEGSLQNSVYNYKHNRQIGLGHSKQSCRLIAIK